MITADNSQASVVPVISTPPPNKLLLELLIMLLLQLVCALSLILASVHLPVEALSIEKTHGQTASEGSGCNIPQNRIIELLCTCVPFQVQLIPKKIQILKPTNKCMMSTTNLCVLQTDVCFIDRLTMRFLRPMVINF